MKEKIKGITLHFIPYSEIAKLETVERIKKLLKLILSNKVIILQGRLKAEEESRLIEDTMIMIGNIKGFKGVELAVISQDKEEYSFMDKMKQGLAKALVGQQDALTIIGPASIVKEMKKDPKKLEIMMK
ncbi:MAG: OapB/ArvB family protein [Candidatus Nanoarchaeia archaeon]